MLNLPKTTEFNKRIPKKKFYEQLEVTPEVKRVFVDQIKNIIWRNKIAPSTANIAVGEKVNEIEVFEVQLTSGDLEEKILKLIEQGIPYHIVFVLHNENRIQVWTAFKEAKNKEGSAYKVAAYYHTDWIPEDSFSLELKGINMDQVYENLVREIAGDSLLSNEEESLKESVDRTKEINSLKQKIEKLQAKMRKEKQFNKKVKLNDELKRLRVELLKLENEKNENGVC
ncbi:DUF4391 domain-containing protein [Ileibacterium valens]|uniref:DUF4391 domain-containing protein n=1 Tax=Ileibacterium valens TaxID=1862668 RepID=UPI00272D3B2B|nr:DUF4391 domain-containing protein [Ileibacterium valens]